MVRIHLSCHIFAKGMGKHARKVSLRNDGSLTILSSANSTVLQSLPSRIA